MSRRKDQRVSFHLDASGVESLSEDEIAAILRGADGMIALGGRTQLSQLLKGSRAASILEHGHDRNPSYGFYRSLAPEEIMRRIDWAIENEYLGIEYRGRLPLLVFTRRGWAIEVKTRAAELLRGLDDRLAAGPPFDFSDLKDRNREMIFLFLDQVAASGRREFIPLLLAWSEIDYAKVRSRIGEVIRTLESGALK